MKKHLKNILAISVLLFSTELFAALSPVAVDIFPPIQFPPSDFDVTGVRASLLWGRQREVYGLDLALGGNITDNTFTGIAVAGLFNLTHGNTTAIGLQAAGLTNWNTQKTRVIGLQAALGLNNNVAESTVGGLEIAAVNLADFTSIYGLQVGAYNTARDVYGLQIGIINKCTNLHGIQIGLLNFHQNGLFVVSPILNVGW